MSKKYRLAIFASGSGTNAEEIMKFFGNHDSIEVAILLSNTPDAYALERAKKFNVASSVFNRKQFRETDEVLDVLKQKRVTHIILAGFLWLIPGNLIKAYSGKIVNIHPALLPRHGGKGMYGMRVHESVKTSGDRETGVTIHLVNDQYDEGEILAQKSVAVEPEDTAYDIAEKVHKLEYQFYPLVIESWIAGTAKAAVIPASGPGPR